MAFLKNEGKPMESEAARMINADKPGKWNEDTRLSMLWYNSWFVRYAPKAFRDRRALCEAEIAAFFEETDDCAHLDSSHFLSHPRSLSIGRMLCSPPLAQERLAGLSGVSKSVIMSMEEGSVPTAEGRIQREKAMGPICCTILSLIDLQLLPWIGRRESATAEDKAIAIAVVADRLSQSKAAPLIRNEQEARQLRTLADYLSSRGYMVADPSSDVLSMPMGTYAFHKSISVPRNPLDDTKGLVRVPVDVVVMPWGGSPPVLIECKSAGDVTNTNKRRKEEDAKAARLRAVLGSRTVLYLFLCGYFDAGYLGYVAANNMDWVWEHRVKDFDEVIPCRTSKND